MLPKAFYPVIKASHLGAIGHIGTLSFHETKNIISGEGGAVLSMILALNRAEVIREKGTNRKAFFRGEVDKYSWVDIGSSYLPSDLIAAFLWAQMEEADRYYPVAESICGRLTMTNWRSLKIRACFGVQLFQLSANTMHICITSCCRPLIKDLHLLTT